MTAVSASLDITFARLGGVATVAILAQTVTGRAIPAIALLCLVAFLCALAATKDIAFQDVTD